MPDRPGSRLQEVPGSHNLPVEKRDWRFPEAGPDANEAGRAEVPEWRKAGQVTGGIMNKRDLLRGAAAGAAASLSATALVSRAQNAPKSAAGPILLTVGGLIGSGNRGPTDPALDQMMAKQKVSFGKAQVFDFAALSALPAAAIEPTLEYDGKRHSLRGPLLVDVVKASGAKPGGKTALLVRAVDGYAVLISAAQALERGFIVATHLDDRPMTLGGLGPLWTIYDADRFSDMASKPLSERFALCPWATYYIEVRER
jgi:hypothetical protein